MSEENVIFSNNSDDFGTGEVEFNLTGNNVSDDDSSEESVDILNTSKEPEEGKLEENDEEEKKDDKSNDSVVISKSKVVLIEKLLQNIKESNDKIIQLLGGAISSDEEIRIGIGQLSDDAFLQNKKDEEVSGRVVEGVFDGENMIGPDGKQYNMPANYASKSKLVEGDIMKLTITDSGTFVYKQIGPIERKRVVGVINQTDNGNFVVIDENDKKWRVLTASVTYYKGQVGDEAVILVPKNGDSKWAAVDNVVRSHE